MAKGLASGDISSVISGGVGMITSATKLFDFKTKKADKEIKKHVENLKKLKTEYDGLARAASQALGTEEYETKVDQIANLEKQKIEVEGQLRAEDSKKRKKKDWQKRPNGTPCVKLLLPKMLPMLHKDRLPHNRLSLPETIPGISIIHNW